MSVTTTIFAYENVKFLCNCKPSITLYNPYNRKVNVPLTIKAHSVSSLLRRGLHEVSSEGKVSAQGVMGRAK